MNFPAIYTRVSSSLTVKQNMTIFASEGAQRDIKTAKFGGVTKTATVPTLTDRPLVGNPPVWWKLEETDIWFINVQFIVLLHYNIIFVVQL